VDNTEVALKKTDQLMARNKDLMESINKVDEDSKKMLGELNNLITTQSSYVIDINSLKSKIKRKEKLLE